MASEFTAMEDDLNLEADLLEGDGETLVEDDDSVMQSLGMHNIGLAAAPEDAKPQASDDEAQESGESGTLFHFACLAAHSQHFVSR